MMCAVKITSGPAQTTSDAPASGFDRRRAQAAASAIVGLIMLVIAHSMSWVSIRPGQTIDDRLLGRAPSTEVRTYALSDLPAARTSLYVGWILLAALLAVAWARPQWHRGVRVSAWVLTLAVALLTFVPGGAALRASGFREADGPDTDFRSGTWLALLGMLLVVSAISSLTASPRPSTPAGPAPVDPTPTADTVAADPPAPAGPTPIVVPRPGWALGPASPPWWRRPWPVTGVVAGAVAAAALIGAVAWQVAHPPAARPGHGGDLDTVVVTSPADATPATPAAVDNRVDTARILPVGGDLRALMLAAEVRTVRHAAGVAWTRPDTATVTVTLLQFESAKVAEQFQQSYVELERDVVGPGGVVEIPDVPGATAFTGAGQGGAEVDAIARRAEIIVLVGADGGPPDIIANVESLVREQYARL